MHTGDPPSSRRRDSASPVGCDWQRLVVENAPDVFSTRPNRFQTVQHRCDHIEEMTGEQRRVAPTACQESDEDRQKKSGQFFYVCVAKHVGDGYSGSIGSGVASIFWNGLFGGRQPPPAFHLHFVPCKGVEGRYSIIFGSRHLGHKKPPRYAWSRTRPEESDRPEEWHNCVSIG